MTTVIATPISQIKLAPDRAMLTSGLTWKTYEALLQELGDDRSTQLAYDRGVLEIRLLGERHEIVNRLLAKIITMLAIELGWKPMVLALLPSIVRVWIGALSQTVVSTFRMLNQGNPIDRLQSLHLCCSLNHSWVIKLRGDRPHSPYLRSATLCHPQTIGSEPSTRLKEEG